jgi:hypothetical protein
MTLTIVPATSEPALQQFVTFPWMIYHADPYWVPPLVEDYRHKLDLLNNTFWKNASREMWIAMSDGRPVGTIAAIIDQTRIQALGEPVGAFGFFECLPDPAIAHALFTAAETWLRERGMHAIRGPYNPSTDEACGFLVEGFDTRPAIMEAHTPPYYAELAGACGYTRYRDLVARLWQRQPGASFADQVPEKLRRVAERAPERYRQAGRNLRIRPLDPRRWDSEIELAWRIYVNALAELPEYVPITLEDFMALAGSFRPILDPRMALIAEIDSSAVGFALAIPDVNQAFQEILHPSLPGKNGFDRGLITGNNHRRVNTTSPHTLGLLGTMRLLWSLGRLSRKPHLDRVSYKMLIMRPAHQGSGIESLLSVTLARAIWDLGYPEVDMSMTGEENVKSNRFQENLGFHVYRRFRLFEKSLISHNELPYHPITE